VYDAITDVGGIEVGQAENQEALTGCTVVLCREGAVVGADVRGSAPGTRETDLCRPGTLVERANAILLTGGSAFGLNAATGVMSYLWEHGYGYDVGVTKVPIVPGAVIFDLALGSLAWPDELMGYAACVTARTGQVARGNVGAGCGASVGKILGPDRATKSGLGTASVRVGKITVGALIVVNALGDVIDPADGRVLAGVRGAEPGSFVRTTDILSAEAAEANGALGIGNTTIGVVATDAALTVEQANHLAKLAHDGLARTIQPVHTMYDGDALFALATGRIAGRWQPHIVGLAAAAVAAVERAVLNAVLAATPAGGLPSGSAWARF